MTSSQGFQKQVNTQPAIGVEGDFCSGNPRFLVNAGQGGLVAGANCFVARFAWATPNPTDSDGAPAVVNTNGSGPVTGFIHRQQQGLNTVYLTEASMFIEPGFPVALYSGGDFFVTNTGSGQALPGMKAYANFADGKATFAATGSPAGAVASAGSSWSIAAETSTITASISGNLLTVTAVSGTYGVAIGGLLTGGSGPATNYVVSQVLPLNVGEALNGIGRYYTSVPEATGTYTGESFGLLTLTTVASGTFGVGSSLSVSGTALTGVPVITQLLTGTGGSGSTAIVNLTQTKDQATNGTLTGATNVETKWVAMSAGLTGELVKISSQPLG